jgi:single-strand DNA-binding protein
MYINKVELYGNLTRDPELKALPSGQQVANFAIATNRSFKNKDGARQEQTEFHNVVAFGRTAEVIGQYLKKGRPIFVEGRLQTRSWDKDGVKQYRTEVIIETFQFGADGGRGGEDGARTSAPVGGDDMGESMPSNSGDSIQYPDEEINPEDIPF